ncbi:ABC transporter ATP-binding protein [Thermophilibacter immobilis]|jgi:ATP-binding cassette subfamily B protein|uniref:ABC transporter ATP-binding protein n=1 Tax=Thermophilibacter immobilis TaxID=2779519 RepID=A0A7S7RUQ3_9ACTN|nr:ABC transporter ATP-binding protein [Thermophilibacter immobilis]QOY60677.1 ABC transporter ATP-binding protein [Thermophilibacter immobilis]
MARPSCSLFGTFLTYYRGQRHLFVADLVCAFVVASVDLAFPQILRALTAGLFARGSDAILGVLLYLGVGLVCMYALRFVGRYFVIFWGHVMGARMESRMREDLFDAYQRMSFSYFDRHKSGDLMSRLISDLFDISEAAHHGPEYLLIGVVEIVGSFVILGTINAPLTGVLVLIACLLVAYNVYANWRMRSVYTENRERISQVNSRLEDSLAGIRVVKSFAAEDVERTKFRRSNTAYLDSKTRMYRAMGRYQAAIAAMMGGLNTVVLVMGGWLIAQGQMVPADLATYALYISLFTTPITSILDFTETLQKAIAGFKRFCEVLATQPDIQDKPGAPALLVSRGAISYHNVHFSYNFAATAAAPSAGGEEVIRGLDLDIEAGKTVALVGPSGGGKSTTCALLPRFYDVTSGSLTIDGQDVRDVTQRSLREAIGLVQQDVYLFDGTIAENIAYGCPEATLEEIHAAARRANIADYVESLPDGYETEVGERGSHLSGGQKQRVAIARVFLKNPPILIFDEATSALDNESEQAVQESLSELSRGRTTIVIAHRLSTIKGAQEIVTMEHGRVVERGTHEELLSRGGTYARYYRMQFADGSEDVA